MQSLRASARAISTNRTNLPLGMTLGRGRAAVAFTVAYIDTRPMDSDAAPAAWAPMLSPPVAITRPLKNKPAPPAAATGLKPSCGVLCEIISRFSLTSTRWRFTSSIRRSEPGKPHRSRGRNPVPGYLDSSRPVLAPGLRLSPAAGTYADKMTILVG